MKGFSACRTNSLSSPEWVYELLGPVIREIREREYESVESAFRGPNWASSYFGIWHCPRYPRAGQFPNLPRRVGKFFPAKCLTS